MTLGIFSRKPWRKMEESTGAEADETVIWVGHGEVELSVEMVGTPERKVSAGKESRLSVQPYRNIDVKFVNLRERESACVTYSLSKSEQLSGGVVGSTELGRIMVKHRSEAGKQTWTIREGEIVIKREKKEILV